MNWNEYRARLAAVGTTLEKDSRYRSVIKIRNGYSEEELAQFESALTDEAGPEIRLWPGFRNLYTVFNGFRFQWQYLGPEELATKTASAQIVALHDIYLPEDVSADVIKRIYDEPRIFDLVGPDDHVSICLHRDHQKPQLLYFSDATHRYHELSLDMEAYFEMLLQARAMYRWQHFFVSDPSFPVNAKTAAAFRHDLQLLFPETNVGLFKTPKER